MAAALRTREGIHVTEPVPVEVAGLTGLMLDITDDILLLTPFELTAATAKYRVECALAG